MLPTPKVETLVNLVKMLAPTMGRSNPVSISKIYGGNPDYPILEDMVTYIYIYTYIHIYMHIYIYIHIVVTMIFRWKSRQLFGDALTCTYRSDEPKRTTDATGQYNIVVMNTGFFFNQHI